MYIRMFSEPKCWSSFRPSPEDAVQGRLRTDPIHSLFYVVHITSLSAFGLCATSVHVSYTKQVNYREVPMSSVFYRKWRTEETSQYRWRREQALSEWSFGVRGYDSIVLSIFYTFWIFGFFICRGYILIVVCSTFIPKVTSESHPKWIVGLYLIRRRSYRDI